LLGQLGRLGGLKGGRARAEKLTGVQRSGIAKKAARARWNVAGADTVVTGQGVMPDDHEPDLTRRG